MIRFPTNSTQIERHQQYLKIRDTIEGEDRIKAAGARYLPKHNAESITAFRGRIMRSSFLNVVRPTLDAMVGKAFRVAPIVDFPDDRLPFLGNGDEHSWSWGAEWCFREVATTGRVLAVVSIGDDASLMRPLSIVTYTAEEIEDVVLRRGVPVSIKVQDAACGDDELIEWRIGEDGLFEVATIDHHGEDRSIVFPSILGRRLNYIPAVFIGPTDLAPEPARPPLIDLTNAALAHYILHSEYRTALYWTASPQPVATGFDQVEMPRSLGPSSIIRSRNPRAKFEFVTFSGDGIAEQRLALAASRADMASIGASILLPKGGSNIAARTVELRQAEDMSVTVSIVNSVEAGINRLISYIADWEGKPAGGSITLNKDMVEATLDPNTLRALREAYQAGLISWPTWIEALQRGEVIPASRSADDERALIESDDYHDRMPDEIGEAAP